MKFYEKILSIAVFFAILPFSVCRKLLMTPFRGIILFILLNSIYMIMARLTRSNNKVVAGVCAGLAENFGFDVRLVRVVFVLLFFVTFSTMGIAYLVLWLLMPTATRSRNYKERMLDRLGK